MKYYFLIIKKRIDFFCKTRWQKRIFLLAGASNVLITNLILQLLLISEITSITLATLFSQILNMLIGYILYGRMVFKTNKYLKLETFISYNVLMLFLWLINANGINLLVEIGISKSNAGIVLIPFLAFISFYSQKVLIFRK